MMLGAVTAISDRKKAKTGGYQRDTGFQIYEFLKAAGTHSPRTGRLQQQHYSLSVPKGTSLREVCQRSCVPFKGFGSVLPACFSLCSLGAISSVPWVAHIPATPPPSSQHHCCLTLQPSVLLLGVVGCVLTERCYANQTELKC